MNLLDERPQVFNQVLSQLRYWDKKNLMIFLENFIQDNCDKISLWLTDEQILDNLENQSEIQLKSQIIKLLQNIKETDNVILRSYS